MCMNLIYVTNAQVRRNVLHVPRAGPTLCSSLNTLGESSETDKSFLIVKSQKYYSGTYYIKLSVFVQWTMKCTLRLVGFVNFTGMQMQSRSLLINMCLPYDCLPVGGRLSVNYWVLAVFKSFYNSIINWK